MNIYTDSESTHMAQLQQYAFLADGGLRISKIAANEAAARRIILRDTSCTDLVLQSVDDVEPFERPEPRRSIHFKQPAKHSGKSASAKESIMDSVVDNLHHDVNAD